jgi:hypothetical protein
MVNLLGHDPAFSLLPYHVPSIMITIMARDTGLPGLIIPNYRSRHYGI